MGASEACCDAEHGSCDIGWCDCGCHHKALGIESLPDFGHDLSSFIDHDTNGREAVGLLKSLSMVSDAAYDPVTRTILVTFHPYDPMIDVNAATSALLDLH